MSAVLDKVARSLIGSGVLESEVRLWPSAWCIKILPLIYSSRIVFVKAYALAKFTIEHKITG